MLHHLIELRKRLIYCLAFFGVVFTGLFWRADELYLLLVHPLLTLLPVDNYLIATQITAPIFTPIKLASQCAMLITIPFSLWQFWLYIVPALYPKEQWPMKQTFILSFILFLCGLGFCYTVVLPFLFSFFIKALPFGIRLMPDMSSTLDFITTMMLTFGLCFQIPLVCMILVQLGISSVSTLRMIRPYVIVGAFTIGMILTPPDILSQIMLALPIWFLYELGIVLAHTKAKATPSISPIK